jgi:hypothetical protein
VKREDALSDIEQMAYDAIVRLKKELDGDAPFPITPGYIKMLKDTHALIMNGMKNNPLGEDMEPEELLIRLEEIKGRLQKKVAQKRGLEANKFEDLFDEYAASQRKH